MGHWVEVLAIRPDDLAPNRQTLRTHVEAGCIAHICSASCSSGEMGVETGGSRAHESSHSYPLKCDQEAVSHQVQRQGEDLNLKAVL